jgi:hypothetical protein
MCRFRVKSFFHGTSTMEYMCWWCPMLHSAHSEIIFSLLGKKTDLVCPLFSCGVLFALVLFSLVSKAAPHLSPEHQWYAIFFLHPWEHNVQDMNSRLDWTKLKCQFLKHSGYNMYPCFNIKKLHFAHKVHYEFCMLLRMKRINLLVSEWWLFCEVGRIWIFKYYLD